MSTRSEAAHSIAPAIVLALVLAGCAPAPPAGPVDASPAAPSTAPIQRHVPSPSTGARQAPAAVAATDTRHAAPSSLPGWEDDTLDGLAGAIDRQCALARPPSPWPELCDEYRGQRAVLRGWLERRFRVQPLTGADGSTEGLITGYLEAELNGSRRRVSAEQVPLYRRPPPALLADG